MNSAKKTRGSKTGRLRDTKKALAALRVLLALSVPVH